MPPFLARCSLLFSLSGALLFTYSLLRLFFYYFNSNFFQDSKTEEVFWAFVYGLRFDISAICYINLPFVLLLFGLLPFLRRGLLLALLHISFLLPHLVFILFALIDSQFFPFLQRRLSRDVIHFAKGGAEQISFLLYDYAWLFLVFGVMAYLLYRFYIWTCGIFIPKKEKRLNFIMIAVQVLLILGLHVLGIRGGLQPKVLSLAHAQGLAKHTKSALILNAPFTLLQSFAESTAEEKNYFADTKELNKWLLSPSSCPVRLPKSLRPRNVVIIIWESLGAQFLERIKQGQSYVPFFERLAQSSSGALFNNAYANAVRSIQSLPSILASIPNWFKAPFVTTPYLHNQYPSLGNVLKERGYHTLFLHGARKGSMYFDKLTAAFGINDYYAYENFYKAFPNAPPDTDDGLWGIYDEPFFLYAADILNKASKEQFFATIFSLSSHYPFRLPSKYKGQFPQGETPFYEVMGYTDHALRRFFQKIEQSHWYKQTLFVILGDHSPIGASRWSRNALLRHRIPILFYYPGHSLAFMKKETLAQQLDIFPTILSFLGIDDLPTAPFGSSLLDACAKRRVVIFEDSSYWLLSPQKILHMPSDSANARSFVQQGLSLQELSTSKQEKQGLLKELQARIQHYHNGLIYNRLLPE